MKFRSIYTTENSRTIFYYKNVKFQEERFHLSHYERLHYNNSMINNVINSAFLLSLEYKFQKIF